MFVWIYSYSCKHLLAKYNHSVYRLVCLVTTVSWCKVWQCKHYIYMLKAICNDGIQIIGSLECCLRNWSYAPQYDTLVDHVTGVSVWKTYVPWNDPLVLVPDSWPIAIFPTEWRWGCCNVSSFLQKAFCEWLQDQLHKLSHQSVDG
jgi:hypothetical protein